MISRAPRVCWGTIGDDLLLWASDDRRLHVLNATAANVWLLADAPTTIDAMVQELSLVYGIGVDQITNDVHQLVDRFLESGLCIDTNQRALVPPPIPVEPAPVAIPRESTVGPFRLLGSLLTVDVSDLVLRSELSRILDPLRDWSLELDDVDLSDDCIALHIEEHGGIWSLTTNGRQVGRATSRAQILRVALSECNAAPLRAQNSSVVFHAAGADLGDGLVVFPGVSNAGKSTLITQLVQRGHRYLSDEAVAVDVSSLHALPFHKSICIDQGAQSLMPELSPGTGLTPTWDVDPRTIGPGLLSPGGPIKALVFPTFEAAATPQIRVLDPFETMQKLISNAFDFDRVGQPAFDAMIRLANALPAYEFIHAGGDQPLETLENLFARTRWRVDQLVT